MAFSDFKEKAVQWSKEQRSGFELVTQVETERRLVFSNGTLSFYVVCPETSDTNWHVWSDDDRVLTCLQDTQDFVMSCRQRSITDILNKVHKDVSPLLGAAAVADGDCEDGGFDEDDVGFDEDMDDMYYAQDDLDAMEDERTGVQESDDEADQYFTGQGSVVAVNRLIKDLKNMKEANGKYGVYGEPRGDNLFIWDVKLTDFPKDTPLGKDLQAFAKQYKREPVVYMELMFPADYPMAPPFARVLRPRFRFLTGHVTIGGSVCMEMLTKSGWRPTNDMESILVQIRSEVMSDPNTRLDANPDRAYEETEARQAFDRMVQRYGWNK